MALILHESETAWILVMKSLPGSWLIAQCNEPIVCCSILVMHCAPRDSCLIMIF